MNISAYSTLTDRGLWIIDRQPQRVVVGQIGKFNLNFVLKEPNISQDSAYNIQPKTRYSIPFDCRDYADHLTNRIVSSILSSQRATRCIIPWFCLCKNESSEEVVSAVISGVCKAALKYDHINTEINLITFGDPMHVCGHGEPETNEYRYDMLLKTFAESFVAETAPEPLPISNLIQLLAQRFEVMRLN